MNIYSYMIYNHKQYLSIVIKSRKSLWDNLVFKEWITYLNKMVMLCYNGGNYNEC